MADKAREFTDRELAKIDRHLSAVYAKAQHKTAKAINVSRRFRAEASKLLEAVRDAKTMEERARYKADYRRLLDRYMASDEFVLSSNAAAKSLLRANTGAAAYITARMPAVYAANYNQMGEALKRDLSGYKFVPVTATEVDKYGDLTEQTVDPEMDTAWNMANIRRSIVTGAYLALSVPEIITRTAAVVAGKNLNSARLHSRGMATDAESKGRLDGMYRASDCGFTVEKMWRSTRDNRTRDSHRDLDGVTIPLDDDFLPGLARPRDPHGPLREICNCRCTLRYVLPGVSQPTDTMTARRGEVKGKVTRSSSFKGTETVTVPNMTYHEWMEWRKRNG